MLDIMRRNKRIKLVLWAVIASLGLGMLLFFIPGTNLGGDTVDNSAATVDGQSISLREYKSAYHKLVQRYSRNGKNPIDNEMLKAMGVPNQVLDALINAKVINIIAKRFGIEITPAEIQRTIEAIPIFQNQGKFIGVESYKEIVANNLNISVSEFEEEINNQLLVKKLREVLTDSLDVGELEIREEFSHTNQKTQVDYALLKVEEYKKRLKPTEAELRSYFDEHKAAYTVKEKRRAQYLLVPFSQFVPSMKINEQEIAAELRKQSHDETVEVAHILFSVSDSAKDASAKAKAEDVLKRAKAGENFAALAKKYSEDPGSAGRGGELGPVHRGGGLVKEFEDAAFSLDSGKISELVKSQYGYHIIKALKHEKPTKEACRTSLILKKARDEAKRYAKDAASLLEKQKDLSLAAGKLGVKAEIKETPLIKNDDTLSDAGIPEAMRDEIFKLKEIDAIGKVVENPMGYAIPKLLEVQMPRPADFSESRSQVEKQYADFKAKELVRADAQKLSEEAIKQGSLEKPAKAMGLSIKRSEEFSISGTPSPEIGPNSQFTKAAFDLKPGAVSTPQSIDENMTTVFQVKSRTPFDELAYQKEKPELRTRLLQSMQEPYFQDYVRRVTEELEKSRKIRKNPEATKQVSLDY
jgi:peptidyl-prolyl cis-trans isomerase D